MIPFSGIIYPKSGALHHGIGFLANGQGQSNPGAAVFRIFQKDSAAVHRGNTTEKYHTQTNAVAAVFNLRLPLVTGEDAASWI